MRRKSGVLGAGGRAWWEMRGGRRLSRDRERKGDVGIRGVVTGKEEKQERG